MSELLKSALVQLAICATLLFVLWQFFILPELQKHKSIETKTIIEKSATVQPTLIRREKTERFKDLPMDSIRKMIETVNFYKIHFADSVVHLEGTATVTGNQIDSIRYNYQLDIPEKIIEKPERGLFAGVGPGISAKPSFAIMAGYQWDRRMVVGSVDPLEQKIYVNYIWKFK